MLINIAFIFIGQGGITAPNEQDIRLTFALILATDGFKRPKRLCELLTYLVGEDQASRSDRNKAPTFFIDIDHRDDDFDQQSDTILRIEAGRLRQRLYEHCRTTARAWLTKYMTQKAARTRQPLRSN